MGVASSDWLGSAGLEVPSVPNTCGSWGPAYEGWLEEWRELAIRGEAANGWLTIEAARSANQELADLASGPKRATRSASLGKSRLAKREQKPGGAGRPCGADDGNRADCIRWPAEELRVEITVRCLPNAPCAA